VLDRVQLIFDSSYVHEEFDVIHRAVGCIVVLSRCRWGNWIGSIASWVSWVYIDNLVACNVVSWEYNSVISFNIYISYVIVMF
jgi:hypothetical protein